MNGDRRSFGKGMLVLGAAAVLGNTGSGALPGNGRKTSVRVRPASGSPLEVDDAEVLDVLGTLGSVLASDPTASAGKLGNELEDEYGDVTESEHAAAYVWERINGHWVHVWELETEFLVSFGAGRAVRVEVVESEPKPL
jgi:hypothetical protein